MESVPELSCILINKVMQVERSKYLQTGGYERTEGPKSDANRYNQNNVPNLMGEITLSMPKVQEDSFYPTKLKKKTRS